MLALSILQPWAWLIVHGHKDIENRTWPTKRRGEILIHAGKRWGREQADDLEAIQRRFPHIQMPDGFVLGCIVGSAEIVDCVTESDSPWFSGPHGFVLTRARHVHNPMPFRGQLGFFKAPAVVF